MGLRQLRHVLGSGVSGPSAASLHFYSICRRADSNFENRGLSVARIDAKVFHFQSVADAQTVRCPGA